MNLAQGLWYDPSCFDELFEEIYIVKNHQQLRPNSALILWGGEDISPFYYKERTSQYSWANDLPSPRDMREWALAKTAIEKNIPIIGICRGAQWLAILAGGSLIQHVEGHMGYHEIETQDGRRLATNSIHHQMMNPINTEYVKLAWVPSPGLSKVYFGEFGQIPENPAFEPEILFFPKIKGLAIQGHPEMYHNHQNDFTKLCNEYVQKYIIG